mmetsp:Transcript_1363/g.5393  ORF Transcript_1363/g.5393 Transcript_1363/m.5393 type:complete len:228 (+) Transcript_1363:1114-1797(+)
MHQHQDIGQALRCAFGDGLQHVCGHVTAEVSVAKGGRNDVNAHQDRAGQQQRLGKVLRPNHLRDELHIDGLAPIGEKDARNRGHGRQEIGVGYQLRPGGILGVRLRQAVAQHELHDHDEDGGNNACGRQQRQARHVVQRADLCERQHSRRSDERRGQQAEARVVQNSLPRLGQHQNERAQVQEQVDGEHGVDNHFPERRNGASSQLAVRQAVGICALKAREHKPGVE